MNFFICVEGSMQINALTSFFRATLSIFTLFMYGVLMLVAMKFSSPIIQKLRFHLRSVYINILIHI
jgi:hypothetical protein